MKTTYLKSLSVLLSVIFIISLPVVGQDATDYITINGIVKDQKNNKKLEYVTISVPGTSIGTITNTDGTFSIKIKDSFRANTIELRHIGYDNKRFAIGRKDMNDVTIYLTANVNKLKDVVITPQTNALELVEKAIEKIVDNNSSKVNMLTGFYRETVKKRRSYITISEAVIDIYKTPYDQGIRNDRVQIFKGRKLLSPKPSDTLLVKLLGGPNLSTHVDIVKNPDIILDKESLTQYKFDMEESVMIAERPHYVVSFKPQVILPYALYYGKLYIDKESLAFSRAEVKLDMDDRNKATQAILRKKPFKMYFKPEEVSFVITYKLYNGKSYLNYIKNEVQFKCDYKRRLFSTNYTIVSEMVVTDIQEENVSKIPYKMAFKADNSLGDKVISFYDPDFWGNYNIIEPTESLEQAISKLKKQYK